MTVSELRKALAGIPGEAVVNVGITFSWDSKSGDAFTSEAFETSFDGPDGYRATANSFMIIGEVAYEEVVKAGR